MYSHEEYDGGSIKEKTAEPKGATHKSVMLNIHTASTPVFNETSDENCNHRLQKYNAMKNANHWMEKYLKTGYWQDKPAPPAVKAKP